MTQTETGLTKLYTTPALPQTWIARMPNDGDWMLHEDDLLEGTPETLWANAEPYQGDHELQRIRTRTLEIFVQPPADWTPDAQKAVGSTARSGAGQCGLPGAEDRPGANTGARRRQI